MQAAFFDETDDSAEFEYVGFWLRVWAGVVDSAILMAVLIPLMLALFGLNRLTSAIHTAGVSEFVVSWILPAILIFAVWAARDRTRGKMAISAIVVDERTSAPPSTAQQCGRYLGYFLAVIPFGLGLLWVAFDPKKQGWHDKLAGTIVVRPRTRK
jgi:uncharacterized RDD family membrane protein YckC